MTADVVNGIYTIPALSANATFIVSVEQTGIPTQVKATEDDSQMKAWATNDGILHIEGLTSGKTIEIFSSDGRLIATHISNASKQEVALPGHGIYIVRSATKIIKVSY